MGLANALTFGRIGLIPLLMFFLLIDKPNGYVLAAVVFCLAAATDVLDGYIARKYKQVSRLGIFLDPLVDKLLTTAALVCLVDLHLVASWIAIVIISREFAVTCLRAVKANEGVVIPASRWGKMKTVIQFIAVLLVILSPLYRIPAPFSVATWAMYTAVLVTVLSGVEYFFRFKFDLRLLTRFEDRFI